MSKLPPLKYRVSSKKKKIADPVDRFSQKLPFSDVLLYMVGFKGFSIKE